MSSEYILLIRRERRPFC